MRKEELRIKVAEHFDSVRNQLDIFVEEKLESLARKRRKSNNLEVQENLNTERELIMSELKLAENEDLAYLEILNIPILDQSNINQTLFKKFPFVLVYEERIKLVIVENCFLNLEEISFFQLIVSNQNLKKLPTLYETRLDFDKESLQGECDSDCEHSKQKIIKWWQSMFKCQETQV